MAKGAIEAGHDVGISLMADAAFILKNDLRDAILGVAMPPLKDLFQFAVERGPSGRVLTDSGVWVPAILAPQFRKL